MQPIFAYREAVGLYQKTRYIMLVAAGLNILLSIVLGLMFGIDGILCAAILSRLMTYFWYEPKILYRDYFRSSPLPYFGEVLLSFVLTMLVVLLGIAAREFIPVLSWVNWLCVGTFIFMLSNLLCVLIYFKRPECKSVVSMLKETVKRENKDA